MDTETKQRVDDKRRRQELKDSDSAAYRSTLAPIAELQEEGKRPPFDSSNFDSQHFLGDEAAKLKNQLTLSPERKLSLGGTLIRPPLSPDPKTYKSFGMLNKSDLMPQFQLGMH